MLRFYHTSPLHAIAAGSSGRVYAFGLTRVRRHGLWLCEPKLPLVCKCASVQVVSGQLSAPAPVSAGGGWRWKLVLTVDAFAHLHTCTLERKPAGAACLRNVSGILRDKARKGSVSIDGKALRRSMNRGGKTPISLSVQMCKCASGHRSVVSTSTSFRRRRLALEAGADR